MTCTNILSALREAGFAPATFPPTKLRQGYGDAVCGVLNALCDLVLETTNFTFQAPTYLAETYAQHAQLQSACLLHFFSLAYVYSSKPSRSPHTLPWHDQFEILYGLGS